LVAVVMRNAYDGTAVKRNFRLPAICAYTESSSTNQISQKTDD